MLLLRSWGQLGLQEGLSVPIELLNYFHDYMIIILIIILSYVTYLFIYVCSSPYSDKLNLDSHYLETIWTILPIVVLLFMAFPSLYLLYLIEETFNSSVTVKVVGHQWYWEYEYESSILDKSFDSYMIHSSPDSSVPLFYNLDVDNRLVLPTLSDILFLVTSSDVLHSWTVPALGIKIDAIPGRLNYLSSKAMYSGVFYGQCSEICGSNHRFMPIVVEFVPAKFFLDHISSLDNS